MSSRIKLLQVNSFRGIRSLQLPFHQQGNVQNVIIFGENGTGKSSIVDALEFYFSGRIDKLSGRQDVKEKECIPYLKSDLPPSVTLELTTYAGRTTALYPEQTVSFVSSSDGMGEERYSRDQVKIKPLDQFFREAATRPFILRRAQLLNFINARPAERYAQISQLIGLGELDEIEAAWRAALNELDHEKKAAGDAHQAVLNQVERLLDSRPEAEADFISCVNDKLATFNLAPITGRDQLPQRRTELGAQAISVADLERAGHPETT